MAATETLGRSIGGLLRGGEVLALNGDVGSGKTTFTKALAAGMGITDVVQSPTFTIERIYEAPHQLRLAHYDFYRLTDPGIMREQLAESITALGYVVVIEWNEIVQDVLTAPDTIICNFSYLEDGGRQLELILPERFAYLAAAIKEEA